MKNEVSQSDKNMTNTETSPNPNCEPSEQVKVREDDPTTISKSTYEATICNDPNNQEEKADIEDLKLGKLRLQEKRLFILFLRIKLVASLNIC